MKKEVSLDLMEFIEQSIIRRYNAFDSAHNVDHALRVMKASVNLANRLGADVDMAYTVAAYHDLGLEVERATHHIESGKILKADRRLDKWFSHEQIEIMKQAVEDHRASASRAPRNIYGKIVAEADRDLEPMTVLTRTIQFGLDHYPQLTEEEQWERFYSHLKQKYSISGYIKLWIPGSKNEGDLKSLRELINNVVELRKKYNEISTNIKELNRI